MCKKIVKVIIFNYGNYVGYIIGKYLLHSQ